MLFDIRTLLVAVTLATAFCAAARLLLWRMHPTIPGLGRWALAGGASVVALVLILIYGRFQWQPALSVAQVFAVLVLILAWDGFRRFIGRSGLSIRVLVVIATIVMVWISIAQLQHSVEVRSLGNAVLLAILSALIARELLTAPKPIPQAMRVTGWLYVANATVFLLRTFVVNHDASPLDPMDPSGVAVFILLWLLCVTIATTLGMVLMTAERLQIDLDRQANRDPLTGALNRRSFSVLYEKAMARARRNDTPLSVLIMDLDKFKQINDQLGHDVGDVMLCRFVATATEILRADDIFCRFGGEEFVALLPDTSADMALVAAERLRIGFATESAKIKSSNKTESFAITVSIGIAELEPDEDFESLLRRADDALYHAKNTGRNSCEVAECTQEKMEMKAV